MLKRKELIEFIGFQLARLKATVATLNAVHFFDLNVVAEDFFADLLNAVYGYSLVNLNHDNLNKAAIDLGDTSGRIAVQVTSQRSKAKIQETLDKFSEHGLADDYDALKIVIIGDRTGKYPTLTIPSGVAFSGSDDVIAIDRLMKDIGGLDTETLTRIAALIRREVSDAAAAHTELGSKLDEIAATQREMLKRQESESRTSGEISETVGELRKVASTFSDTMLPDAMASVHQVLLDLARDYLKDNKPTQVVELLGKRKDTIWPTANGPTKARLLCTMGSAKFALGAETEAAHLFLEARQYNPDDEKVLSHVAVAYLLVGDTENATDSAETLLQRNPANVQAYSVLIQSSDDPLDELIERVPEYCRMNSEVALAIGFVARRRGDLQSAREWLQIAVDNDADNHPDMKGTLGETILHSYTGDSLSPVRIEQLNEATRTDIQYALTMLDNACAAIRDDAALRLRVTWLLNAGIACRLLSNDDVADKYLSRATQVAPDHPAVRYHRAIAARDNGDLSAAIEISQSIEATDELPQLPLIVVHLLWQADRIDEAIEEANAFIKSPPSEELAFSARQILVELLMEQGKLEDAQELSKELVASAPTDVSAIVSASQVLRAMGQSDDADATLDKAYRVSSASTPSTHHSLLGNELGATGRWAEAATVFERVVDTTVDSPLTRKYIQACYQASLLKNALSVCKRLREANGPMEFVTDIEVAILEETGDLSSARAVCEGLIQAFPENEKRRVQAAVIFLRQHDDVALDAFLDNPPDWRHLPIECGQQIARLYAARTRYREAITLLYEMRRVHSVGKVHLQYLQTFLFDPNKHEWLEVHECGVDVAVCIKDSNDELQWYIIEDRQDVDVAKGELPLSHPLAQALLGKKPNDTVLLKESPMSSEEGVITEIKSKFVHAFHESDKVFEVCYPDQAGGFVSMKMKPGEEGVKEFLTKLERQEDERKQDINQAHSWYASNPLPIGAVARFLQCDIIQAWSHLTKHEDGKVICASGTAAESESAVQILDRESVKCVVDPVSLMTIHALSLADEIVSTVGRLGVAQATIDLLTETLDKRRAINRRGFMTLTKEGQHFVRREVTAAEVESYLLSLETLIKWIDVNCDILPWSPELSTKREDRMELREFIGDESLDTILACCDSARALYSDDLRLRQLAKSVFNVDGLATQPVLMRAVEAGIIDREKYNRAVIRLASAGYLHTRINGEALLEAARQADWAATSPFSDITWLLRAPFCDEDAAVRVVADFLRQLWQESLLPRSTDYLVFRLLDELAMGRSAFQVADKLIAAVARRFIVIPIAESELAKIIGAWRAVRIA